MTATAFGAAPSGPSPRGWRADRQHADWPRVRVEGVEVIGRSGSQLVRAVVQLGGLTPVDVHVELIPAADADAGDRVCAADRRMWSSHAQDNGCFVYESTFARHDDDLSREWLIRVHPTQCGYEPPVLHRFLLAPG